MSPPRHLLPPAAGLQTGPAGKALPPAHLKAGAASRPMQLEERAEAPARPGIPPRPHGRAACITRATDLPSTPGSLGPGVLTCAPDAQREASANLLPDHKLWGQDCQGSLGVCSLERDTMCVHGR